MIYIKLEKVNEYKYLGITLDYCLSLDKCFKCLADSGVRALGAIINKFKFLKNVGFKTFTTLFNTGVKTVLQYGSTVWGSRKANKLDNVQNRAMRYFLGVHKYTPVAALLGDMGWFPLYIEQYVSVARFWNRLLHMDDGRLTKSIFEADYRKNSRNWSSRFQSVLKEIDCENIFEHKEVIILSEVKTLMEDNYKAKWLNVLASKPKLRTYRQFKFRLETESYVKFMNNRRDRSILAQFRSGVLPLAIETGRYKNVAPDERFCFHCITQVESEIHFILHCPLYLEVRQSLLDKAMQYFDGFEHKEDIQKLEILLKSLWKESGIFLNKAWELRRDALYGR